MEPTQAKSKSTAQTRQGARDSEGTFFQHGLEKGQKPLDSSFFGLSQGRVDQGRAFFARPSVQPKLKIGQPGDRYEVEADRVADRVVQGLARKADESVSSPLQDDEPIQRKPIFESESEPAVQAKVVDGSAAPTRVSAKSLDSEGEEELQRQELDGVGKALESTPDFDARLESTRGSGVELPEGSRRRMEQAIGSDFGGVRLHTGSEAVGLSQEIGAQAFTSGSDVYFNEGRFAPGTAKGDRLLAHELTHVVQQGAAGEPERIDRQVEKFTVTDSKSKDTKGYVGTTLEIGKNANKDKEANKAKNTDKKLTIDTEELQLPKFKGRHDSQYKKLKTFEVSKSGARKENPTDQRALWVEAVRKKVAKRLEPKLEEAKRHKSVGKDDVHYFKLKKGADTLIAGNEEQLVERMVIPFFDRKGKLRSFHVDHVVEYQLGGKDEVGNYELLEAQANMSSGGRVSAQINKKIREAYKALKAEYKDELFPKAKPNGNRAAPRLAKPARIRRRYEVHIIAEPKFVLDTKGHGGSYWKLEELQDERKEDDIMVNDPVDLLRPLTPKEKKSLTGEGAPKTVVFGSVGGHQWQLPDETDLPMASGFLGGRIHLKGYDWEGSLLKVEAYKTDYTPEKGGTPLRLHSEDNPFVWPLKDIPGIESEAKQVNVKRLDESTVLARGVKNSLRLPGLSPIRIDSVEFTSGPGLIGRGKLLPSVPLVANADIDVVLTGDELRLEKTFNLGEFNLPRPFQITDSTLRVFAGTEGLGAEGNIALAIDHVGEGEAKALVSTAGGFELQGCFRFDTDLFTRADVELGYRNKEWSFSGTLGIDEGTVRGVKSAEVTVGYERETLSATGSATLDVPGVERGNLNMRLGPAGFSLGGDFALSSDIPGIESGSVNASLSRSPESGQWQISAGGTAVPSVPGIASQLTIQYDDGIITIGGNAAYERGILSGQLEFGATNRGVDAEGTPTDAVSDSLRVFGGGELAVTLTPWLKATAGVRFLENGEMEVEGRLGLPAAVDVFDRQEIRRNLFKAPTIEIPLFAVPLGVRSIGLVAQIDGGLDFEAGFGPGQLRQLEVEMFYNPDHPEQASVTGRGQFVVPADAGLVLSARLGVGASVAIASATGGIEIAGALGLEAEASAGVEVNWSPTTGIALDAEANVSVNPKFRFEVNAFVKASLDLAVYELSETSRTNLAAFEWGPDISFGLRFPVRYRQGEPFSISYDDLEVTYPPLDIPELAGDLARDIKDRILP